MSAVDIRTATLDDLPILREFEQGVIEAERPLSPTLKSGAITYYDIEDLISSDQSVVLVATSSTQPIGCGYAKIYSAKPHFRYEHYAYLGFMYILPTFRRRGITSVLIESLCSWAKERNVSEIQLEVYANNLPAIAAYEKAGFRSDLMAMRKKI